MSGTRLIIAGSRTFTTPSYGYADMLSGLIDIFEFRFGTCVSEVVCGMAKGMDLHGHAYAKKHEKPVREFPADWATHGLAAGAIRNAEMAKNADGLLLIWDGKSSGSANMLETMQEELARRGIAKDKWAIMDVRIA